MGKRVAISQSNYIPWKGYFDMIARVDEFILYDEVQYTRRDWRNRNRIKTASGIQWLTIPVEVKGKYTQRIDETLVNDPTWNQTHWGTLQQAYARAPYFDYFVEHFKSLYQNQSARRLSLINRCFLETILRLLEVPTPLKWSNEYQSTGSKSEKLIEICQSAGATHYLSGPAAKAYLDESAFTDVGIQVEWMDYSSYPEYPQLHPPFDHAVSILDLLFSTGPDAKKFFRKSSDSLTPNIQAA